MHNPFQANEQDTNDSLYEESILYILIIFIILAIITGITGIIYLALPSLYR